MTDLSIYVDIHTQGKEHELESRNQIMSEEWKRQDEELGRRRQERLLRAQKMAEQENLARLQDEMTRRVNRLLLSREARVLEIERSRAGRAARESVNEALESAERQAMLLQKAEMDQATERAAQLATEGHTQMANALQGTVDQIRKETGKLMQVSISYVLDLKWPAIPPCGWGMLCMTLSVRYGACPCLALSCITPFSAPYHSTYHTNNEPFYNIYDISTDPLQGVSDISNQLLTALSKERKYVCVFIHIYVYVCMGALTPPHAHTLAPYTIHPLTLHHHTYLHHYTYLHLYHRYEEMEALFGSMVQVGAM